MKSWSAVLFALRLVVGVAALGVVGLCAWTMHTAHQIDLHNEQILSAIQTHSPRDESIWRDFFDIVLKSRWMIWIAIGTSFFTLLSNILIAFSSTLSHLDLSPYVLIPLETLSTLSMGAALAFTTVYALNLHPFALTSPLPPASPNASTATSAALLTPLSKTLAITCCVGVVTLLASTLCALIRLFVTPTRASSEYFEPTASTLGMAHGFETPTPPVSRSANSVPSLYDPLKRATEIQQGGKRVFGTTATDAPAREDSVLAKAGSRESIGSSSVWSVEEEAFQWPLVPIERPSIDLYGPDARPPRPWSTGTA